MYEQTELAPLVRQWQAAGKWKDHGRWRRASNGTLEYLPTRREIAAKCRLYRSIAGWHGAYKRAPRGGRFGVATTKGL
jgi:hypothetical protein